MKGIIKKIDSLVVFSSRLSAIFLSISVVLITSEIFARAFLNSTIYITSEFSSYLMCAISFTTIPFALKEKGHIRMSILLDKLKGKNKEILNMICNIIGFGVSIILFYYTFLYFWDSVAAGSQSMTITMTYLAIPQFFMPFGCSILVLQFFSDFLKNYLVLIKKD